MLLWVQKFAVVRHAQRLSRPLLHNKSYAG